MTSKICAAQKGNITHPIKIKQIVISYFISYINIVTLKCQVLFSPNSLFYKDSPLSKKEDDKNFFQVLFYSSIHIYTLQK